MVIPLIFRAAIPLITRAAPFIGRGIVTGAKGIGKILTTRTGQLALFAGGAAISSPKVREVIRRDPTVLVPQIAIGKVAGRFIEGQPLFSQQPTPPPLSTPAFDPVTGRPRFKTKNGLSPLEKGAIAIGGAGIGGLILGEAVRRIRARNGKQPIQVPPIAGQIPTPIITPVPTQPSPVGRIPVTPVTPEVPTEVMETERVLRQQIPQIKLTANPKINVVIQNSNT